MSTKMVLVIISVSAGFPEMINHVYWNPREEQCSGSTVKYSILLSLRVLSHWHVSFAEYLPVPLT
jgi:hypothetical protein